MNTVDRCVVRERFGQFQFGQRFVLADVYCLQAPPPGTEIEKLLLLCPTDVIEASARAIDSGQLISPRAWSAGGCCVSARICPEACSIHLSSRGANRELKRSATTAVQIHSRHSRFARLRQEAERGKKRPQTPRRHRTSRASELPARSPDSPCLGSTALPVFVRCSASTQCFSWLSGIE